VIVEVDAAAAPLGAELIVAGSRFVVQSAIDECGDGAECRTDEF
jgi:hypothetical protein